MNLEDKLIDLVFGSKNPTLDLIQKGKFPKNWVSQYLSFLDKATNLWGENSEYPRKAVASIHFASFYLNIRYEVWQKGTGQTNEQTEKLLASLRTPSELFLLGSLINGDVEGT